MSDKQEGSKESSSSPPLWAMIIIGCLLAIVAFGYFIQ